MNTGEKLGLIGQLENCANMPLYHIPCGMTMTETTHIYATLKMMMQAGDVDCAIDWRALFSSPKMLVFVFSPPFCLDLFVSTAVWAVLSGELYAVFDLFVGKIRIKMRTMLSPWSTHTPKKLIWYYISYTQILTYNWHFLILDLLFCLLPSQLFTCICFLECIFHHPLTW